MNDQLIAAQLDASRLRRENQHLRVENRLLLTAFAIATAIIGLVAWHEHAPVSWLPLS